MLFISVALLSLAASAAAQQYPPTGQWFDNYIVVVLENMGYKYVISNPVFEEVAKTGILQTNYHGVTHPSQPNCKSVHGHRLLNMPFVLCLLI